MNKNLKCKFSLVGFDSSCIFFSFSLSRIQLSWAWTFCDSSFAAVSGRLSVRTLWLTGRSGLAVTCLTAVWEDQGLNPVGSCRFFCKTTTIYSLAHGLHTLTAVPRSTQPSTRHGMVKWVSAFGLSSNNKWSWWVWLLAACRWTHSLGRLAWAEGQRTLGAVPYSSYEPVELLQWLWLRWQHHKHYHPYYYYYFLNTPHSKDLRGKTKS